MSVHCLQRSAHLSFARDQACQTQQLGEPWTSASQVDCYWECVDLYPDTCQSIVFNNDTKTCTPGAVAFRPLEFITTSIPSANSTDTIYVVRQPVPHCDTSSGNFDLYEMCGLTLCLNLSSSEVDYHQAKEHCKQMASGLFMTNTVARLSMFWHLTLDHNKPYTWVGLNDLAVEGQFVWENGEPISPEQWQYIWSKWQPDNANGGQDCVEVYGNGVLNPSGLDDDSCSSLRYYMCEP
ncbi:CD209 antigen [Elysia marginata]|uniref:CD209 antigen n=1 Tax=Elysia marginata TaxID=1093978 RepID=A0AAV4J329_9GAST|nr:CD209 antigen [Elysia marginata]